MTDTTIPIVEDEAIVAADLESKLRRLGYKVTGITSEGPEAVSLCRDLRPNLLLMDIRLDGPMDGIETAKEIRPFLDVPVIYLTAHSDSATIARAKLTGPFGYILKPFEERELATQIELATYKHRSDRLVCEQREWFRVTLNSIGDAVIAADAHGRLSFLNSVAESMTGWKAEQAMGEPVLRVFRIVDEQTGQPMEDIVERILREGGPVPLAEHAALVAKDGTTLPVEDSASPILDAEGKVIGVVLVFQDVTEKRRTQETLQKYRATLEQRVAERTTMAETQAMQLRQLALELSDTEDRERKRFASMLHDDLQQILAAMRFRIQMIDPDDSADSAFDKHVLELNELVEESIRKSRSLYYELSPPVLHRNGLFAALEWLAKDVEEKHGFKVAVKTEGDSETGSQALDSMLFRSVKELLFNAVKHSGADSAQFDEHNGNTRIRIRVTDQGKSFDPSIFRKKGGKMTGFGLFNIEERIRCLGGRFEFESSPEGTGKTLIQQGRRRAFKNNEIQSAIGIFLL